MVTIKDIAVRAGVSFSTVSKALRDSPLVKPQTKAHVLAIAREMGYQPNYAARSLVSKKTGAIGVVWPSIESFALSSLLTAIHEELTRTGYSMLLSLDRAKDAIETFRRFRTDAVLLFGDEVPDGTDPAWQDRKMPLLVFGVAGVAPYAVVDVNRGQAIRLALRHLAELGHKRIAYFGEVKKPDPLQAVKIEAFHEEAHRLELAVDANSVVQVDNISFPDGYWAARSFLKQYSAPTAIISGSSELTRGLLRAAIELGIRVPHDLSLISYDNYPQMASMEVPVTTVGVALHEMASSVVQALLALIRTPDTPITVELEPELVIRESTAPPRATT
jgi:LacI family transcriptional regulator